MDKIIFLLLFVILTSSCDIKIPLIYTFQDKFRFSEEETSNLTNNIITELEKVRFDPTGNPLANACDQLFIAWLKRQLAIGFVPKREIPASEYAAEEHPKYLNCKTIDTKKVEDVIEDMIKNLFHVKSFLLSQAKEKLPNSKCINPFLDAKKEKVDINKIIVNVEKNTLNFKTPATNIYYSTEIISDEDFKKENSEDILKKKGRIKLLARLPEIDAGFVGKKIVQKVDKERLKRARKVISKFKTQIVFYWQAATLGEEILKNEEYFLVPKGAITIGAQLYFQMLGNINDALCFFNESKEKLRKEDEGRKARFNKKNS